MPATASLAFARARALQRRADGRRGEVADGADPDEDQQDQHEAGQQLGPDLHVAERETAGERGGEETHAEALKSAVTSSTMRARS
jgi:hypothetical protein